MNAIIFLNNILSPNLQLPNCEYFAKSDILRFIAQGKINLKNPMLRNRINLLFNLPSDFNDYQSIDPLTNIEF